MASSHEFVVTVARAALFITHAEVLIDPGVPVPRWGLSDTGRARHEAFNASDAVRTVTAVYCSGERKAIEGAEILARAIGRSAAVVEDLRENDRSATGFLPSAEFQATAELFFAHPDRSIRGWERAADAQARIVACVDRVLHADQSKGDVAIVAHGGVGALLLCHLIGIPISRSMDQPGEGGGNYFAFRIAGRSLIHGWQDIGRAPAARLSRRRSLA